MAIVSSPTVSISSTYFLIRGNVFSPTRPTAMPSANVWRGGAIHGDALFEREERRGRGLRLHSYDHSFGEGFLCGNGASRNESSSTHGNEYRIDAVKLIG